MFVSIRFAKLAVIAIKEDQPTKFAPKIQQYHKKEFFETVNSSLTKNKD